MSPIFLTDKDTTLKITQNPHNTSLGGWLVVSVCFCVFLVVLCVFVCAFF